MFPGLARSRIVTVVWREPSYPEQGAVSLGADELAVLAWSVALIAVFAPTAVYLYRRKVLR